MTVGREALTARVGPAESWPDSAADDQVSFDTQVECSCCAHHLADAPEFDWIWNEDVGRWEPFCACPRHHLGLGPDAAGWLFVRYDYLLMDGHPVKVGMVSWPLCDACLRAWIADGLHPDEGRVLRL